MVNDYLDAIAADIAGRVPPSVLPPEDAGPAPLFRIYALLARAKGEATTLEDVHDAWSVWMGAQDPSHEALLPFGELSDEQRTQDQPFLDAIQRHARERA